MNSFQTKDVQTALKRSGFDPGPIDGIVGPKTLLAVKASLLGANVRVRHSWSGARLILAYQQLMMSRVGIDTGDIDGLLGPQTEYAFELWQNHQRDTDAFEEDIRHQPNVWPRQRDVPAFYGERGQHQVLVTVPYPMKIAWNTSKIVTRVSLHEKVAESGARAFVAILAHYGFDKIERLGIDLYSGSLNVRRMRGGEAWSMHSWGIALDFDHTHNQFRWGADKARFAKPEYDAFWNIWESEGWISLGREQNFDWMHIQAARL